MKHKVLYYMVDGSTEAGQAALDAIEGGNQIELVGCAHEPNVCPTAEQLAGCEGFVGEFGPVDDACADAMAAAGMRIVSNMSIGLNHVAVDRLASHGITVTNCPGYCSDDVAQHTVALMLDLMRQVTLLNRDVRDGAWNPLGGYTMHRTQGRTLGLVFFWQHRARRRAHRAGARHEGTGVGADQDGRRACRRRLRQGSNAR